VLGLAGLASKPGDFNLAEMATPAASWDALAADLKAQQTPLEQRFRADLAAGRGANHAAANLRLFGAPDGTEPRVVFYRDSASWCPYCHKVWLVLEEKQVPYRVERVNMSCYGDKPPSFRQLQPSGQIPVCVIDGAVYGQSNDIIDALERTFTPTKGGHPALLPDQHMAEVNSLLQLERRFFGAWLQWLTGGARNQVGFESALGAVEAALQASGGPFFLGQDFSLVDAVFAPFLERAAASLAYFKGFAFRTSASPAAHRRGQDAWPAVQAWFDAMERRPSYRATKSDYYTHAKDLPPQVGAQGPRKQTENVQGRSTTTVGNKENGGRNAGRHVAGSHL
jgi:glutathione S-transferase